MDALKVSKSDIVVFLHPSKSNKVSEAVLHELGSMLFKFSESFDGVLLAYDVKILDNIAKIVSGINPYICVKLRANLLLFTPKPNMLLEGKVVKISQESIHVIVLGFSSAIIIKENIREEFKYKIKHGESRFFSTSDRLHVIKVGTIIRFLIISFDEEILHFSGSLLPAHTGSVLCLDKPVENHLEDGRNNKLREKKRGSANLIMVDKMSKRRKMELQQNPY